MSYRDQWKMIHLLNTSGPVGLTTVQLEDMAIRCYHDTIGELINSNIVISNDLQNGPFTLHPITQRILNNFILCRGDRDKTIMYVDQPSCFVIMPFNEPWSDNVYENILEPAIRGAGLTCIRGDEIDRVGQLNATIFKELQKVGMVVAEITLPNANVYYELGVADTLGKEVFALSQKGTQRKIAADKEGIHYYEYDPTLLNESKDQLIVALKKWIKEQGLLNTPLYCKL